MLRRVLVILGGMGIVAGVLLMVAGRAYPEGVYLLAMGLVLSLALLFERYRYRPRVNQAEGHWEETNERFIDPLSGHLIVVRYNPDTGARDYVDIGAPQ